MGLEIRYCDRCGSLVAPGDAASGKALSIDTGTLCGECLRSLTPEQQNALRRQSTRPQDAPAVRSKMGTKRRTPVASVIERASQRSSRLILAASISLGVCCGAVIALLAIGGGDKGGRVAAMPMAAESLATPLVTPRVIAQTLPEPQRPGMASAPAPLPSLDTNSARTRLDEISEMITPELDRYDDIAQALKYFPTDYPDSPELVEAERILEDVEAKYAVIADEALAAALRTAGELESTGAIDEAMSIVRSVQARFRGSSWAAARGDSEVATTLSRLSQVKAASAKHVSAPNSGAVKPATYGEMVVHWDFRESAPDSGVELRGFDAAARSTHAGGALALDGNDDYALTPQSLAGRFPDESITALIWLRPESAGVILTELGQPAPSTGWHNSLLEISPTGVVKGRVWGEAKPITLGTAALSQWHVMALRYDATSMTLTGFLDGKPARDSSVGRRLMGRDPFFAVGPGESQNMGNGGHLRGAIKEVRIYAHALTDGEIAKTMAGTVLPSTPPSETAEQITPKTVLPDGSLDSDPKLVLHFTFDEGRGLSVRNASGEGNGALRGMDAVNSWVDGKVGRALQFDGNGDYIEISPMPGFAYGTGVTFALWVKIEECEQPVIMDQAGREQYLSLSIGSDNRVRWEVAAGKFIFAEPITRGVWHHLAGTYDADGGLSTLYIDGRVAGSAQYDALTDYSDIPLFLCSRDRNANGIRGTLDDVRVYARALDAQEIGILHTQIDAQIAALAKTPAERKQLLLDASATPGSKGYALDLPMLIDLGRSYDATRIMQKRIAAIGGALAASKQFDSYLRTVFTTAKGYTYAGRMGLAATSLNTTNILKRLQSNLAREKPEIVRILPHFTEIGPAGSTSQLRDNLIDICQAVREAGSVPVLMTLPVIDGSADNEVDMVVRKCNDAVRQAAHAAKVPYIDAFAYLNRDPEAKKRNFTTRGRLTTSGRTDLGEQSVSLYLVLERWVMKREGEDRATISAAHPNAIPNGGFEQVDSRTKFAATWSKHNWGDAATGWSVRLDKTMTHSGECALVVRSLGQGAMPGVFTRLPASLSTGTYELSLWGSAEADKTVRIVAMLGNRQIGEARFGDEWSHARLKFSVAEETRGALLKLRVLTSSTRVWIDDVALIRTES